MSIAVAFSNWPLGFKLLNGGLLLFLCVGLPVLVLIFIRKKRLMDERLNAIESRIKALIEEGETAL